MVVAEDADDFWRSPSTKSRQNGRLQVDADHCAAVQLQGGGKLTCAAAGIHDHIVWSESDLPRQCRRLKGGKITPVLGIQLRGCSAEVGLHPARLMHNDSEQKGCSREDEPQLAVPGEPAEPGPLVNVSSAASSWDA